MEEVVDIKLGILEEKLQKKLEEKLQPMREALKQVLKAQIEIVDKIADLERDMSLVTHSICLTPASRELRKTLHDID